MKYFRFDLQLHFFWSLFLTLLAIFWQPLICLGLVATVVKEALDLWSKGHWSWDDFWFGFVGWLLGVYADSGNHMKWYSIQDLYTIEKYKIKHSKNSARHKWIKVPCVYKIRMVTQRSYMLVGQTHARSMADPEWNCLTLIIPCKAPEGSFL